MLRPNGRWNCQTMPLSERASRVLLFEPFAVQLLALGSHRNLANFNYLFFAFAVGSTIYKIIRNRGFRGAVIWRPRAIDRRRDQLQTRGMLNSCHFIEVEFGRVELEEYLSVLVGDDTHQFALATTPRPIHAGCATSIGSRVSLISRAGDRTLKLGRHTANNSLASSQSDAVAPRCRCTSRRGRRRRHRRGLGAE